MISRRAPLMELGAFDDDYFAYLEDVDFGWRSWIAGYRVLFEPRALVRHASSTTSNRLGDFERGVLFERNALQTAIKNLREPRRGGGSVFFTYLHRLHHYATTRNPEAKELTREPFSKRSHRRDVGRPHPAQDARPRRWRHRRSADHDAVPRLRLDRETPAPLARNATRSRAAASAATAKSSNAFRCSSCRPIPATKR